MGHSESGVSMGRRCGSTEFNVKRGAARRGNKRRGIMVMGKQSEAARIGCCAVHMML